MLKLDRRLSTAAAPYSRYGWTGKRNRDFYCDAGRHRKRDRNSDEAELHLFSQLPPANANSSATTINGNAAQAKSTATGSSGQAQATAQTNFGNFQSVQSTSTSPLQPWLILLSTASAIAQAGGVVSLSNPIIAGQSFSVVSGSGFGPLTVANGSMGAGYGGTSGISVTYQESASFTQIGGAFVLDLLSSDALGKASTVRYLKSL